MLVQTKTALTAAARARIVAEKEIPAGSVVIVEHQLAESLDAAGRWKLVEENLVAGGGMGPGGGGLGGPGMGRGGFSPPMGGGPGGGEAGSGDEAPSPMQRGKNRVQQERYAGLRPDERRTRVWADVRAWAGDKPVFWLARSVDQVDYALPVGADFHRIAELDAPMMLGPGGGGGGPMAGGMGGGPPGRGGRGGLGRGMAGGNFGPPGMGGRGPGGDPGFGGGMGGAFGPSGGRAGIAGMATGAKLRVLRLEFPKTATK
jgi:hypothetical protein